MFMIGDLFQAGVGSQGSVMAYRDNYLDLDPTYKDVFMRFDGLSLGMALIF